MKAVLKKKRERRGLMLSDLEPNTFAEIIEGSADDGNIVFVPDQSHNVFAVDLTDGFVWEGNPKGSLNDREVRALSVGEVIQVQE